MELVSKNLNLSYQLGKQIGSGTFGTVHSAQIVDLIECLAISASPQARQPSKQDPQDVVNCDYAGAETKIDLASSHEDQPKLADQLKVTDRQVDKLTKVDLIPSGSLDSPQKQKHKYHDSQSVVAIKTLRNPAAGSALALREVHFFRNVPAHPHLVKLYEMVLDKHTDQVSFVLEHMDANMLQWISARRSHPLSTVSALSSGIQLLRGIAHIHAYGFVHRDLKPENILVSRNPKSKQIVLKIADFGLSRQIDPLATMHWTSYVATRWYRSPEQVLGLPFHTPAVDVWSFGCLMAELCNFAPLFPGQDMLHLHELHLNTLGSPSRIAYGGPWSIDETLHFSKRATGVLHPEKLFRNSHHKVFGQVIQRALQWDPSRRPAATEMLLYLRRVVKVHK